MTEQARAHRRIPHPVLARLGGAWLTWLGANEVVTRPEAHLVARRPADQGGRPLLVTGTFGDGRTLAWTSEIGPRSVADTFRPALRVRAGFLAYELAYGKGLTPFLRGAKQARSRRVADGVGMPVEQAVKAFARWCGARPRYGSNDQHYDRSAGLRAYVAMPN